MEHIRHVLSQQELPSYNFSQRIEKHIQARFSECYGIDPIKNAMRMYFGAEDAATDAKRSKAHTLLLQKYVFIPEARAGIEAKYGKEFVRKAARPLLQIKASEQEIAQSTKPWVTKRQ